VFAGQFQQRAIQEESVAENKIRQNLVLFARALSTLIERLQ